jgi:hypothetical protein
MQGVYEAKKEGFLPGGASLHSYASLVSSILYRSRYSLL